MKPLISIWIITYNQEEYIAKCIEGVLMQRIEYPIEIIISDDCSTDKTYEICIDYKEKHPNIINLIRQEKNIGLTKNWIETLKRCSGDYIAMCEGDDYWTDSLKLQKQISFLELNIEYSAVSHDVTISDEASSLRENLFLKQDVLNLNEAWGIFLPTCSMVFRNENVEAFYPKDLDKYPIFGGDSLLILGLAKQGKIKFLKEKMATYRINQNSISINLSKINQYCITIPLYKFIINNSAYIILRKRVRKALLINYGNLALAQSGIKQYFINILSCFSQIRNYTDLKIVLYDFIYCKFKNLK